MVDSSSLIENVKVRVSKSTNGMSVKCNEYYSFHDLLMIIEDLENTIDDINWEKEKLETEIEKMAK